MSNWDSYSKDAEVTTGGDFPTIPDDLYDAMIQDVTEPETSVYEGQEQKRFIIKWELTSGDVPEGTTLWQYITLPDKYLTDGLLSEKSNLYKTMAALGFDMEGRFRVNPPEWQGMEARVMVENRANLKGEMRSKITSVKAKRGGKRREQPAEEKREPVAAGTGKATKQEDDWD